MWDEKTALLLDNFNKVSQSIFKWTGFVVYFYDTIKKFKGEFLFLDEEQVSERRLHALLNLLCNNRFLLKIIPD